MKYTLGGVYVLLFVVTAMVVSGASVDLYPNGAGTYSAWFNQSCPSNAEWQCVDETSPNTADYLYTTSPNASKESFQMTNASASNLTGNNSVTSVTAQYYAMQVNATDACFRPMLRVGSSNYFGSTKCPDTNWTYVNHTWSTNPATGASWTVAELDALQVGMESNTPSSGGKIRRVAQVFLQVVYT